MSYFLRNGNTFKVTNELNMDLHEKLPAGNYVIKLDVFENFFLEQVESFSSPSKVYGRVVDTVSRMMTSFEDRPASTGVLLTGEKGSGKTLLARALSIECASRGIPCIVINTPWRGDKFNTFIQSIDQACMILFDEFEKVYDREEQTEVLTLLDGVFPSKKLFVLTCNDKWRLDEHMHNRPGRIFYLMDFRGLDEEFIIEYCKDNLKNQTYIDTVCRVSAMFKEFNFDMLKALIEEMNRFNESPQDALKLLNIKPEFGGNHVYDVSIHVAGTEIPQSQVEDQRWHGNPLQGTVSVDYYKARGDENYETVQVTTDELTTMDIRKGKFVFNNKGGVQVTLTRQKEKEFTYMDF